jgi:dihydrofolate synthase/folylpolyglutamate synthase
LAEIAREKGGIVKPGVPVIVAPQESEAMEPLLAIARTQGAALTAVGRDWHYEPVRKSTATGPGGISTSQEIMITVAPGSTLIEIPSNFVLGLLGQHQQNNAVVALATLETVADSFPGLSMETISEGLANVEWPGRLQVLSQGPGKPTLLLDCAHNVDSAEKLASALTHDFVYEKLRLIIGVTVDKDVPGILKVLCPLSKQIILTTSSHPRATKPAELLRLAHEIGYEAASSQSVDEAVIMAWRSAGANDLICVTGSIFVVGDLLNHWESLQFELKNRDQT